MTAIAVDVLFIGAQGQVIGGDLTGVGFLGAGVIVRLNTGQVCGLTMASIRDVSGLSVLIGAGQGRAGPYLAAILLAALALIILNMGGHALGRPPEPAEHTVGFH